MENYEKECNECKVNKDAIKGINCNVCNCHYHDGQSNCLADCISVGPSSAQSSAETLCTTFKPKQF